MTICTRGHYYPAAAGWCDECDRIDRPCEYCEREACAVDCPHLPVAMEGEEMMACGGQDDDRPDDCVRGE